MTSKPTNRSESSDALEPTAAPTSDQASSGSRDGNGDPSALTSPESDAIKRRYETLRTGRMWAMSATTVISILVIWMAVKHHDYLSENPVTIVTGLVFAVLSFVFSLAVFFFSHYFSREQQLRDHAFHRSRDNQNNERAERRQDRAVERQQGREEQLARERALDGIETHLVSIEGHLKTILILAARLPESKDNTQDDHLVHQCLKEIHSTLALDTQRELKSGAR